MTTSRTEADYLAATARVVRFVQSALDEVLTPRQLADVAGFSTHHFHRVFRAVVGETVMDFVRRLRLERAAHRLKTTNASIAAVALDGGYGSQEAFTRAFLACYGQPPRDYRRAFASHEIPSPSGVHYDPQGWTPLRRVADPEILFGDGFCAFHRDDGELPERLIHRLAALVFPPCPSENPMTEANTDVDREIEALQREIDATRQRLSEARRRRPKEPVQDYVLKNPDGSEVRLSELFGGRRDLIVIHNMGSGCPACTMWADGISGLAPHLLDRAAFTVCSPDRPEVMRRFAERRNWRFRMVSAYESPFIEDMGFWEDGPGPGVSTFRREEDGTIVRVGRDVFDAGDDYCAAWHLFDLLHDGVDGWFPKVDYDGAAR